jgi:hypothetical protein
MPALSSIVAKSLILAEAVSDDWVAVGNYVHSPECAELLQVTPLECGREMYGDASWIMMTAFHWLLPYVTDLMAGLALAQV